MTLPEEVVHGLQKLHADLGWAIVSLFEQTRRKAAPRRRAADAELVTVSSRRSLIVVNKDVFSSLPGVNIIPLHDDRAFLALEPGRGMSDLELAVIDRLAVTTLKRAERQALQYLLSLLRQWRRDRTLQCTTRAIIVLEQRRGGRARQRPLSA